MVTGGNQTPLISAGVWRTTTLAVNAVAKAHPEKLLLAMTEFKFKEKQTVSH